MNIEIGQSYKAPAEYECCECDGTDFVVVDIAGDEIKLACCNCGDIYYYDRYEMFGFDDDSFRLID